MGADEGARPGGNGGRSRTRRVARFLARAFLALVVLVLASTWYAGHVLSHQFGRIPDPFVHLGDRPDDTDRTTFLLVLGDRAAPQDGSWLPGRAAVAAVELVTVDGAHRHVRAVSIPLVARFPGGPGAEGLVTTQPPSALVRAVERVSGERVDHVAVVDLDYVRVRAEQLHGLELDDGWHSPAEIVGRFPSRAPALHDAGRQQHVLAPLVGSTVHQEFRREPRQLWAALQLFARHTAVEEGWSGVDMGLTVLSLRNLRSAAVTYPVAPVRCDRDGVCELVPRSPHGVWADEPG